MKGFPDGPVVGTQDSHCHWPGLIPGWGTKIPQPTQCSQKYIKISICDMQSIHFFGLTLYFFNGVQIKMKATPWLLF